MRILYIASGYLPYTFSENLCNGKLVYAMKLNGWDVDVISRVDEVLHTQVNGKIHGCH